MTNPAWNRCNVCGKFVAYQEFVDETAISILITPDAYGFEELWDTYHVRCNRPVAVDAAHSVKIGLRPHINN